MGNYEAGTAFVQVVPSMRNFHRSIARELKKHGDEVEVPVKADTKDAEREVNKVRKSASEAAKIKVQADTTKAQADIKTLIAQRYTTKVTAEADTARAQAKVAALSALKPTVTADVDADVARAEAALRKLEARRITTEVDVQADISQAEAKIRTLMTQRETSLMKIDADTSVARAKLNDLKEQNENTEINVDAEIKLAETKIKELTQRRNNVNVDVDAEIGRAEATIAQARARWETERVQIDADTAAAHAKLAAVDQHARGISRNRHNVHVDAQGAERALGIFTLITAAVAGLGAAAPAAVAGVSILSTSLGALAQMGITTVTAFNGVGEAVKATNTVADEMGNATESQLDNMNDAMARITDEGRSFVQFYTGDFRNAMGSIGDAVQSATLPQFELALRNLTSLTPIVRTGMVQMGQAVGDLAVKASEMMSSGVFRADFATIMAGNTRMINSMGEAGLSLLDAFRSLTVASLPMVNRMVDLARESLNTFNVWIQGKRATGELTGFFDLAGDALTQLGSTIRQVVVGFGQLATVLAPVGIVLLDIIGNVAELIGNFAMANPVLTQLGTTALLVGGSFLLLGRGLGGLVAVGQSATAGFRQFGQTLTNTFIPSRVNERLQGLTTGMAGAGLAATGAERNSGRFLGTLTRVGSYLPIAGLAVAGVATAVEIYNWRSQAAARETKEFRDQAAALASTLDQATGAVTAATREKIAHRAAQEGMIDKAKELGLDTRLLTDALSGERSALADVRGELDQHIQKAATSSGLWKNYSTELQGAGITIDTLTSAMGGNQQAIDTMNGAVNRLGGAQGEVGTAVRLFTGDIRDQGGAAGALRGYLDESTRALFEQQNKVREAAIAMGTSTSKSKELSDAQSVLKNEFAGAEEKANALRISLDLLNGGEMAAREATRMLLETTDGLSGKFQEATANSGLFGLQLLDAGGKFNLATNAGRILDETTMGLITRMTDSATAAWNAAGGHNNLAAATDAARHQAQIARDEFVNSAIQLGLTRDQANKLADSYGLIPDDVVTVISDPGSVESRQRAAALREEIQSIPQWWFTEIDANTDPARNAYWSLVGFYASRPPIVVELEAKVARVIGGEFTNQGYRPGGGGGTIPRAMGGVVEFAKGGFASGGLNPMEPIAQVVPPNTWRVVGDRMKDDEAYIPINTDPRSQAILAETAKRMGFEITPTGIQKFAKGAVATEKQSSPAEQQMMTDPAAVQALTVAVQALTAAIHAHNSALLIVNPTIHLVNQSVLMLNNSGLVLAGTLNTQVSPAVQFLQLTSQNLTTVGLVPLKNEIHAGTVPALQLLQHHAGVLSVQSINALAFLLPPLRTSFAQTGIAIRDSWTQTSNHIGFKVFEIGNHFRSLQDGMRATENAIFLASQGIRDHWSAIQGYAHAPMKWVVDVVWNTGLLPIWNGVAGIFGQPELTPVQFRNRGGAINGLGGGNVPGRGDKDTVPAMLTPGEVVFSKPAVANMGGLRAVTDLHDRARNGVSGHHHYNTGGPVQYLQGGGAVGGHTWPLMWDAIRQGIPGIVKTSDYRPGDSGYHGKGQAIDVGFGDYSKHAAVADWIGRSFPHATQVISAQWRGGVGILNGRPHYYAKDNPGHVDHVHWAMSPAAMGGQVPAMFGGGSFMDPRAQKAIDDMKALKDRVDPGVNGFFGGRGDLKWPTLQRNHSHKVIDGLIEKLNQVGMVSFGGGGGGFASANPNVVEAVRETAAQFGWNHGPQWDALVRLIEKESSWNPAAANPTSSARGLFQKMTSIHGPVEPTPGGQALWGLNYIRGRHVDPIGALAFHNANNWYNKGGAVKPTLYDSGGVLEPGPTLTYNGTRKPEAVLTNQETVWLKSAARNSGNYYSPTIHVETRTDASPEATANAINRNLQESFRL